MNAVKLHAQTNNCSDRDASQMYEAWVYDFWTIAGGEKKKVGKRLTGR